MSLKPFIQKKSKNIDMVEVEMLARKALKIKQEIHGKDHRLICGSLLICHMS